MIPSLFQAYTHIRDFFCSHADRLKPNRFGTVDLHRKNDVNGKPINIYWSRRLGWLIGALISSLLDFLLIWHAPFSTFLKPSRARPAPYNFLHLSITHTQKGDEAIEKDWERKHGKMVKGLRAAPAQETTGSTINPFHLLPSPCRLSPSFVGSRS